MARHFFEVPTDCHKCPWKTGITLADPVVSLHFYNILFIDNLPNIVLWLFKKNVLLAIFTFLRNPAHLFVDHMIFLWETFGNICLIFISTGWLSIKICLASRVKTVFYRIADGLTFRFTLRIWKFVIRFENHIYFFYFLNVLFVVDVTFSSAAPFSFDSKKKIC